MLSHKYIPGQLRYPKNTLYKPIPDTRCCDVCMPDTFPVEYVELLQPPRLKSGPREKFNATLQGYLREALVAWRDSELLDMCYPGGQSIISHWWHEIIFHPEIWVETYVGMGIVKHKCFTMF